MQNNLVYKIAAILVFVLATPAAAEYQQVRGTPGFWRLAEDEAGAWWFVSPEGEREFLNTVTTVVPYQEGRRETGPHYVSRDWHGEVTGSMSDGDTIGWATATLGRVRAAGFKGLGAWSHKAFHDPAVNPDTPITRDLNLWTWCVGPARRIYHPDFAETVEQAVIQQVTPLRDSRTLVGYYTDNELNWSDAAVGPAAYFDGLSPDDPSRREVAALLRELYPDVADFNRDFGTNLENWADLDGLDRLPHGPGYGPLSRRWIGKVAADYFRITSDLVRRHDPNHLILGVRYKGYAPPEVVAGQRGQTDAISINYYVADAKLDRGLFDGLHDRSGGQPVIVGEYSFHALDGRSGNRNTFGFVAQVPDQRARADGYRLMTRRLASVPYVVGADWFQWNDEPPSGRRMDGEDVNFGVVDVDDHEYEQLTEVVREVTPELNDLHAAAGKWAEVVEAWRPDFLAGTPTASLPYLAELPRIDASLREWDESHRLADVRRGFTVGADRREDAATPTVYAGWNERGLYVAVEVIDPQIQAAAADGPWWTQDAVELFVSTRADTARPDRGYSVYDHQFFFVPDPFPASGRSGTWARWSRPGDLLDGEHQIPARGLLDASRVLPGKYVTEVFIPADALHGFDASGTSAMRFNVHVRDYQTAVDHYWSAPKEAGTQFKPATWGTLVPEIPAEYANAD